MELTRSLVRERAAEYEAEEPLSVVEQESIETLPEAFPAGEFGFRDAEWVVQWYYRRYLGAYPDRKRREAEERFGRNERKAVREAVQGAATAEGLDDRIGRLQGLDGVNVPIASAFLQFIDPDRYVAVDERTWNAMHDAGELDASYPDPPSVEEYHGFVDACRRVSGECGVDCWTLYRALWRLGSDEQ